MPELHKPTSTESWTIPSPKANINDWFASSSPRTSLTSPHGTELDALVDLRLRMRDATAAIDKRIAELQNPQPIEEPK